MFGHAFRSLWRSLTLQQCPTAQQLAEYADQQSIGADRHRIERHLATCDQCLQQIGFLVRNASGQMRAVPAELFERAQQLGARQAGRPKFPWGWATVATGALAAVLAISVVVNRPERLEMAPNERIGAVKVLNPGKPESVPTTRQHGALRGADSPVVQLILYPKAGQTVPANEVRFRWTSATGVLFYELQVLSDDGDVIWETESRTTSENLPSAVRLVKGHTYYVRIRVHGSHGTVEEAQSVPFVAG